MILKSQQKANEKINRLTESKTDSSSHHSLFKVEKYTGKRKDFKYGYDIDEDFVYIGSSDDGSVGEIYTVQGLRIALPKQPKNIESSSKKKEDQVFVTTSKPDSLKKIKTIFDFKNQSKEVQEEFYPYIEQEFDRRENGYWFMCNGEATYITGSHYMFLNWNKIDTETGLPDWRQANRIFHYFWEACKADSRCYGMIYLKNRRSGFSYMASSEIVNQATRTKDSNYGILSKSGEDAKELFTNKVVGVSLSYPFFFKPIQSGEERPKKVLEYDVPSRRLTRNTMSKSIDDGIEGLGTSIDFRTTGSNAYDGYKLKMLIHDESAKWLAPNNILKNWRVVKTTLRLGSKIVGKCMMGSTSNALNEGGQEYKDLYTDSNLATGARGKNGQTKSGLYSLFINAFWGWEGKIDKYGWPIIETPETPISGIDNSIIYQGIQDEWDGEVENKKDDFDDLNEFYRQFPLTEKHAFRDKTENTIFNLTKIYEQIDYNEDVERRGVVIRGNLHWKVPYKKAEFHPDPRNGRFYTSWIPHSDLQNNVIYKNNLKHPGNSDIGVFGCDSYDISGTVDPRRSSGALHGITLKFHLEDAPVNQFFLEYIHRPPTVELFYEDMLLAMHFYGMPILVENNKPGLLFYMKRKGYRPFSISRPDKATNKLSTAEKELGGIPNTSEQVKQFHATAISTYIEENVGITPNGDIGNCYLNRTLEDWAKFDISNRTAHDASISSGFALMAANREKYRPDSPKKSTKYKLRMGGFDNTGIKSKRKEANWT